jgi:hypothetical protein
MHYSNPSTVSFALHPTMYLTGQSYFLSVILYLLVDGFGLLAAFFEMMIT